MAGLFDHIGPTAHHAPSVPPECIPLLPTKTHKKHLLDVHDLVLPATKQSRPVSLSPTTTKSHTSAQRSLLRNKSHLSTAAAYRDRDHERRYHPPIADVLS